MPRPKNNEVPWRIHGDPTVNELMQKFEQLMDAMIARNMNKTVRAAEIEMMSAYGDPTRMEVVLQHYWPKPKGDQ